MLLGQQEQNFVGVGFMLCFGQYGGRLKCGRRAVNSREMKVEIV